MSEVIRVVGHSNSAPTTLHCLVTTKCSLGCPGCYYRNVQGEWSKTMALRLVDEAAEMGVKWFAIGGGEPMEWEHLEAMTDAIHTKGCKVAITTNGLKHQEIWVDAVHISHDRMHCPPSMQWEERKQTVKDALYFWGRVMQVKELGINMMAGQALDRDLFDKIDPDTITLLLPKPFVWDTAKIVRLRNQLEYKRDIYGSNITLCADSCLAQLLGSNCCQGRTSMAIDQALRCAVCSNSTHKIDATSLADAWKQLRCQNGDLPKGCIVKKGDLYGPNGQEGRHQTAVAVTGNAVDAT